MKHDSCALVPQVHKHNRSNTAILHLSAMVSLAAFFSSCSSEQVGLLVSVPALEAERFSLIFNKNLCWSSIPVVIA